MVHETKDWKAWIDLMPPGPPTLHVEGTVQVPNPGYEAGLVKPDNAKQDSTLVLEVKTSRAGEDIVTQVVTPRDVEYQEASSDYKQLEQVKVLVPDGEPVMVPIQKVH